MLCDDVAKFIADTVENPVEWAVEQYHQRKVSIAGLTDLLRANGIPEALVNLIRRMEPTETEA